MSVLKPIYSPLRIFSNMRGVTGGSDDLWVTTTDGGAVGLVPWTVTAGLIAY